MTRLIRALLLALAAGMLTAIAAPANAIVDRDCGDFPTQAAAQAFFLANGGPGSDPHRLDSDGDGIVCESNPCPCNFSRNPGPPPVTPTRNPQPTPTPKPQPQVLRQWAKVTKVTDGDTIKVKFVPKGGKANVRLIGLDTPEVYGGAECGGPEASDSMKALLPIGTRVLLVSDPTQDLKDRYGRILRYVMKRGKLDVARKQIARGHSEAYVYDKPFQRVKTYRKAERKAFNAAKGIWSGEC